MAPKTVQELFNLKPEELNTLTVLSGLEGFRGEGGRDVAAVAANVLARRLKGNWGGIDIRNIAKAPGQYVAVDNYTMEQLADPNFGARILGGEAEFNRLRDIVNNSTKVAEQFQKTGGAQSFRGPSASKYMQPTDYMPVPGKSNFYFNPLDKTTYQKGMNIFGSALSASSEQKPSKSSLNPQNLLAAFAGELLLNSPVLQNSVLNFAMKEMSPVQRDVFSAQSLTPVTPYLSSLTNMIRLPGL